MQVLSNPRTLGEWRIYLLELATTGAIRAGLVAGIGSSDFVKTRDWTYSRQEIDDMVAAVSATSSAIAVQQQQPGASVSPIKIQGEQFDVTRRGDGHLLVAVHRTEGSGAAGHLSGSKTTLVAAVGKSKKYLVAAVATDDGATDPTNSRCAKEVQWMTERMLADGC